MSTTGLKWVWGQNLLSVWPAARRKMFFVTCKINSARAYSFLLYQLSQFLYAGFFSLRAAHPFLSNSLMWTQFPTKGFLTIWEMKEWDICKQWAAVMLLLWETAVHRQQTKEKDWRGNPSKPTTTSLGGELGLVKNELRTLESFKVLWSSQTIPPQKLLVVPAPVLGWTPTRHQYKALFMAYFRCWSYSLSSFGHLHIFLSMNWPKKISYCKVITCVLIQRKN